MKLSEAIAYARSVKGLTLRDVEKKSGVSNALISQIETGKISNPGFHTVVAIAKVLALPIERLAKTDPG